MFSAIKSLFSSTVGKHNKDIDDWFGANSWWGKLTGEGGQVVKDEIGGDLRGNAQSELVTKVVIGYIVYKAFLD